MRIHGSREGLRAVACYFEGESTSLHGILEASDEPGVSHITTPGGRRNGLVQFIPRDRAHEVKPIARELHYRTLSPQETDTWESLSEGERKQWVCIAVEAIRLGARMP